MVNAVEETVPEEVLPEEVNDEEVNPEEVVAEEENVIVGVLAQSFCRFKKIEKRTISNK